MVWNLLLLQLCFNKGTLTKLPLYQRIKSNNQTIDSTTLFCIQLFCRNAFASWFHRIRRAPKHKNFCWRERLLQLTKFFLFVLHFFTHFPFCVYFPCETSDWVRFLHCCLCGSTVSQWNTGDKYLNQYSNIWSHVCWITYKGRMTFDIRHSKKSRRSTG